MPVSILITQAIIVSILALVFLFMPTVNSSYWVLVALAVITPMTSLFARSEFHSG